MAKITKVVTSVLAVCLLSISSFSFATDTDTQREKGLVEYTYETIDSLVSALVTPFFSEKDTECMARNIFHEAANEPEEGMVAVGVVTINRVNHEAYPKTVCGVVNQRGVLGRSVVCQFSWTCMKVRRPKEDDPRWQKSIQIAEELASGGYMEWREKYQKSLHYHAYYVNPRWKLKRLTRTGAHIFYH